MPVIICPRCKSRKSVNDYDDDFECQCNSGKEVLDQELVLRTGDYEDEKTKQTVEVPNANLQGSQNRLNFTRAGIEGERFSKLDATFDQQKRHSTHRKRQHYEHIPLKPN